jgi:hypothetical protein
MITDIALSIEATSVDGGEGPSGTRDRLHRLGGQMTSWTPAKSGQSATALFKFENPVRRDRFLAEALAIPGVSLTPLDSKVATEILRAKYRAEWDAHQVIADHNARLVQAGKQISSAQSRRERLAAQAVERARDALRAAMSSIES